MIRQATVADIRASRITRRHGEILIVTRFYPRYLKKTLVDRYASELAPPKELLLAFKDRERELDETAESHKAAHDEAFDEIHYEEKFHLSGAGLTTLKLLADESTAREIYLVCHCKIGDRCHREILMLIAKENFGAKIAKLHFDWSGIRKRLPDGIMREA